jgi:hypothetical protein
VFTADHGESLGANGYDGHGATVYEEEARVPLAIQVPGQPGGEVTALAGNIDILPTIVDALGGEPRAHHAGRSLLPLLAHPHTHWERGLYLTNGDRSIHGMADGRSKLVYSSKTGAFHRFDLVADPREVRDRFDPESPMDQLLLRRLLYRYPELFAGELGDDDTRDRLTERLRRVSPDAPTAELDLLFRLAARAPSPALLEAAERIFRDTRRADVRLDAVRRLFALDPDRWSRALSARLAAVAGQPEEEALVRGLAVQAQPPFAPERVAARMSALVAGEAAAWRPWLRLVQPWPKPEATFGPPLAAMLGRVAAEPALRADGDLAEMALSAAATVEPARPSALAAAVRPFLDHPDPGTQAAACRALGALGDAAAAPLLRAKLDTPGLDVRVRQALLHALAALDGPRAVPLIAREGKDPLLTVDAIQILGRLGSRDAVPFLSEVRRTHYNAYTRRQADEALALIAAASGSGAGKGR